MNRDTFVASSAFVVLVTLDTADQRRGSSLHVSIADYADELSAFNDREMTNVLAAQ